MTSIATELPQVHDFDFLVGDWAVHNRRLRAPLSGARDWYELDATATSRTLHNGAISVDEMWYPDAGFAGCSFRTRDRHTGEWTIYWVNSRLGTVQAPVSGYWKDGELLATGRDVHEGREIHARFRWSHITAASARWEQEFSVDGSVWESNWVMEWTRQAATTGSPISW